MTEGSVTTWLEDNFQEVDPLTFYRDLFPKGSLDRKGAMTKGKYCGIAVQLAPYDPNDPKKLKAMRYSLTDELDNLEELVSSDLFTIISPLSYAGKTQKAEMQRQIFAIAIDLDNTIIKDGDPVGLRSLFSQIEGPEGQQGDQPRPTYVVASSAKNLHLYYLFDRPIDAFAANKESVAAYKTWLTKNLWNKYVTKDYDSVQQEPIGQSMRAVGGICKNPEDGRVRAFLTGDKVSIEYLNGFPYAPQITLSKPSGKREKIKIDTGNAKPRVYEWWLRKMDAEAKTGRRYFCCLCAAIFARKCGIDKEKLEQDILDRVPALDAKSIEESNRFTVDDALKAITAYEDSKYILMRRATLERLSGIPIPPNKRNGRKREDHVKLMNAARDIDDPKSTWRNKDGAPTKQIQVIMYAACHPRASQRDIARKLGISPTTVNKWLKQAK